MVPRKKAIMWPEDVCAVCRFYRAIEKDVGLCWAEPAKPLMDEEGVSWDRGAYAEPGEPACIHFKPHHHA